MFVKRNEKGKKRLRCGNICELKLGKNGEYNMRKWRIVMKGQCKNMSYRDW